MAAQNPTFADGSSSTFPGTVDNWGSDLVDNNHTKVTALRWNQISDATVKLQEHTLQVVITGKEGVLVHNTDVDRPAMLYKVYTVSITGSASRVKTTTIPGPAFTTPEKNLFSGTPLSSGSSIHLWVRKSGGDSYHMTAYQAAIDGPISDAGGDSGIPIGITVIGQDQWQLNVAAGTYIVTFLITK